MDERSPAVILDRDGVLNVDTGYASEPAGIEWIAGAAEAVRLCNQRGFLVLVITNQSGVGRNYYDETAVQRLHAWMAEEVKEKGGFITAFYYCPHHPDEGCSCRKPRPGLFLQAIKDWGIDIARSFSVGDKERDIAASVAAGIPGYRFEGGNLAEFLNPLLER